jgi:cytochrome c oxidase subunit II
MDTSATFFLPPSQSTIAPDVDALFNFLLYATIGFMIIVAGGIAFFVISYRRRGKDKLTAGASHNFNLEVIWTVIPTLLAIIVFSWGLRLYLRMYVAPKDALEIKVTAQKWFWSFDYPSGKSTVNELVVPAGKAIKLLMSSKDVIHGFYIPDFRIKIDVLPSRYSSTWFDATYPGEHDLLCTQYCGTGHSSMLARVRVLPERDYNDWLQQGGGGGQGMSLAEYGKQLYGSKACVTCHRVDGVASTGPSFKDVFGESITLAGGAHVKADENYLRESILDPQAKIVAGYQPVMPTYKGILDNRQVDALVAYIKSLAK